MSVRRRIAALVLWPLACGLAYASISIEDGPVPIEINDHGLLVGIGIEREPAPGFGEWFGVSFVGPSGHVERVGLGRAADWAGRSPVEPLRFWASDHTVTAITRAAELEIRTDFTFDRDDRYLLAKVTLTNRGDEALQNLSYSRECRSGTGEEWTCPDEVRRTSPDPADVVIKEWRLDDLAAGASSVVSFSYRGAAASAPNTAEVPLALWTDVTFPDGLPVGEANGISWGDYDADGFIDIFACQSANLWRNVGGQTWELAADLDSVLPPTGLRYGASFGDYDNDGLPDIGTEPRKFEGDDYLHLLKNLGGGPNFVDVATDPAIVDVQPFGDSETLCWGDVDDDGNLDLFLPVYPPSVKPQQPGNFFLFNLGPTGPAGAHRFSEMSEAAGLDNPPGNTRPEGAQFVDADLDGDMDLYSNGALYRNVSAPGVPAFEAMTESASGIGLSDALDEGALFFDYDLDGDFDLFMAYVNEGIRIWESYGDGTFHASDPTIVESPFIGLGIGISAEDWDNDGDIDFTTREVFRRNLLIEDGQRRFTVATNSIPPGHLTNATPAWGDWDKDGDFDCALGNFTGAGDHFQAISHFYENTLYTAATADEDRRYVRVRPVGNSAAVPAGLENQYAASVEIHLLDGEDSRRRKKFVASSHGYLNQNEYTLSFGLPADPVPSDPDRDLRFDVTVDFPGLPVRGLWRVDKFVNPALGGIDLATLVDREIKVYRCGEVVIDGVLHEPPPLASPPLTVTAGGLALPTATAGLPDPTPVPPQTHVGLSFNTLQATDDIRVKEIILDGLLDDAPACAPEPFNVAFWDVTDLLAPFLVAGGALDGSTSVYNHRSYLRTDVVLESGREYRVVARVKSYRPTAIQAPVDDGPIEVSGGLRYQDAGGCGGQAVAGATEVPEEIYLALRFDPAGLRTELADPVGETLTVAQGASGPELSWVDLPQAAGYEVLRCDAAAGPCTPVTTATTDESSYTDPSASGDHLWYAIRAFGDCGQAGP